MKNLYTPLAILIAGFLVSGAIIFSMTLSEKKGNPIANNDNTQNDTGNAENPAGTENIKSVSADDHIRGSLDADAIVVEFSDLECPFCKSFHDTMAQIVGEYNGKVSWVYRHFPLDSIHPKARKEAEASECAAELGGNEKFWAYIDRLFEVTPSNNRLDASDLPKIAEYVELNAAAFQSCLDSGKYASEVQKDLNDATASGGRGTPYSVVIAKDGTKYAINGAQPYEVVKGILDNALGN